MMGEPSCTVMAFPEPEVPIFLVFRANYFGNFILLNLRAMDKGYVEFVADLKQRIIQSRYVAARLANKEQLLLYFKTGEVLAKKIAGEKWGAKVLDRIAFDLQKQLPGLRGFSARNLRSMRLFFTEYHGVVIWQSVTAKMSAKDDFMLAARIEDERIKDRFWGISFPHHILLLNKCRTNEERFFYIEQASAQFWSVRL